jgi:hypothetical protein
MTNPEINRINLNDFIDNQPTQNANEQQLDNKSINMLSSFMTGQAAPNLDLNNPNLIQNISDVKREIVEDTIKQLDSVRYSSFAHQIRVQIVHLTHV